ncbi:MAG: DNA-processing protein DprA [Gammaproteobacteria bacterium]
MNSNERDLPTDERRARLALWRTTGIGGRRFKRLMDHFGSALAVLDAVTQPGGAEIIPAALIERLREPDWAGVDADLAWADAEGRALLFQGEPDYPELLQAIPDPSPVLFVLGNPALLNLPQLAVVGSRNPTAVGRENARAFAAELASMGLIITSGMAYGVDAEAHHGALEKGRTIAVLGHGLDHVYPRRHLGLRDRIAETGAVISEMPIGVKPEPASFPRRNRIIAGLSLGTLVVEAAARSGSLSTARFATEAGRDVFAIPGSIHNAVARGCHQLIRDGAVLVESTDHVAEVLEPWIRGLRASLDASDEELPVALDDGLDAAQQQLLEAMEFEPLAVDQLVERSGLTAPEVSSMLLILELRGHVASASGGLYTRTRAPESE